MPGFLNVRPQDFVTVDVEAAPPAPTPLLVYGNEQWAGGVRSDVGVWSRFGTSIGTPASDDNVWIWDVAMAPDNPSRLYAVSYTPAGANAYFWTSADGGVTWTQKTEPAWGSTGGYLDSPQDGHCYASGTTGIWKTTNNGDAWTKIIDTTGQGAVGGLHVASTKIWYLVPGNATAQVRYANLDGSSPTNVSGSGSATLASYNIRSLNDTLAIAFANQSSGASVIWKITPSGVTNITPTGLATDADIYGVEIVDALTYLALIDTAPASTSADRIYRTVDGGNTWVIVRAFPTNQGPTAQTTWEYRHLARGRSHAPFVVCHGRTAASYQQDILLSLDGGATWTVEKNTADITWGEADPVNFPGDTTRIYSGAGCLNVGVGSSGGTIAPETPPSTPSGMVYGIGTRRLVRYNAAAGIRTELLAWASATTGPRVAAKPGSSIVVIKDNVPDLRRSTDQGTTWTTISANLPAGITSVRVRDLYYDEAGTLWMNVSQLGLANGGIAGTLSGFYKSTNDGNSWTPIGATWDDNDATSYRAHFGPTTITFDNQGDPAPQTYRNQQAPADDLDPRTDLTALAARGPAVIAGPLGEDGPVLFGFISGTGAIWRVASPGSGVAAQATVPSPYELGTGTWTIQNMAIAEDGLHAAAQFTDGAGNGKFLYSTDGGVTWAAATTASSANSDFTGSVLGYAMRFKPGSNLEVWVLTRIATDQGAYSLDGGVTWTDVNLAGSTNTAWLQLVVV